MSEYYAVVRSTDHLAHYGVKGMKWGVRRAIAKGNARALDRNFRRAARKLRKLTDIGLNSKKYAAKAIAYGAAAAGTGTVAAVGTSGFTAHLRKKAAGLMTNALHTEALSRKSKTLYYKEGTPFPFRDSAAKRMADESKKITSKADKIDAWGNHRKKVSGGSFVDDIKDNGYHRLSYKEGPSRETGLSRNTKLRIASGAATVGLGALSAVNAYRATHPKKYRQKAIAYKNAMDEAFAGTKYAGKYIAEPRRKRNSKRR